MYQCTDDKKNSASSLNTALHFFQVSLDPFLWTHFCAIKVQTYRNAIEMHYASIAGIYIKKCEYNEARRSALKKNKNIFACWESKHVP